MYFNTRRLHTDKGFATIATSPGGAPIKNSRKIYTCSITRYIESLLNGCYSCVKWNNAWSLVFEINFGVRQGSVLSPFLFAVYLNDLSKLCSTKNCAIVLYADDIMLLSSSVTHLEL